MTAAQPISARIELPISQASWPALSDDAEGQLGVERLSNLTEDEETGGALCLHGLHVSEWPAPAGDLR